MAWALLAWRQPLRVAQTRRLARHRGVAPGGPVGLEVPTQPSDRPTPRVPLREEALLSRGQETLPGLVAALALGKRRGLEMAHDGHPTAAQVPGHRAMRPALAVQRPDLCLGRVPPCPARPASVPAVSAWAAAPGRRSLHRAGRRVCDAGLH